MSESIEPQPTESVEAPPTRRRSGGAGPRVFISYRRDDCLPHANLLATTLRHRLDADVCLDIDSIPAGADYPQYIASEVALSDALIVMIGDEWIDAADADGRRRLDNPKDWVRLEIKSALERNITVIPALVEGAPMPDSAQLPDELAELADRNAVRLRDDTWSVDFTALADGISVTREPPPAQRSRLSGGRPLAVAAAGLALAFCVIVAIVLLTGGSDSGPGVDGVPAEAKTCGPGIYANAVTSWPFAINVADDYGRSGADFRTRSPVTGDSYAMHCTGIDVVTCTGGADAAVYIVY